MTGSTPTSPLATSRPSGRVRQRSRWNSFASTGASSRPKRCSASSTGWATGRPSFTSFSPSARSTPKSIGNSRLSRLVPSGVAGSAAATFRASTGSARGAAWTCAGSWAAGAGSSGSRPSASSFNLGALLLLNSLEIFNP